ncbi:uncharacterized protein [Populus alba]|uniref:uncharacterized protein n=1 Tax=Populus alba TaxID=43335 RepID=UPI00158DE26F|nr:uncharacterized protein LOC118046138 [Populus alba]
MGCVLGQQDETRRKERAIYYLSKKFTEYESRYTVIEKLCCALAWATKRLRQYMLYHTTWLISKLDPLRYICEKPYLSSRIARWQVLLAEYDIVYMTRKAVKGSVIADHLADHAMEDYEPLNFDFPDEDVFAIEEEKSDWWVMYFDGAVNVCGNGAGAVIISPDRKQYPVSVKLQFGCTNNMVEYEACILGLKTALEMNIKKIDVRRWSCGCRRCGPGVDEGTRPVLGEEEDAAAGWVGRERRRGPLWPATAGAAVEVGEEMSRCGGGLLCRWVVVVAVDG